MICAHCGHPVFNPGARLWLHVNPDSETRGWTFCDSVPGYDDRSHKLTRATPAPIPGQETLL